MDDNLIKSDDRVRQHGEVFTPKRIVNEMLNQPDIKKEFESLESTFLETSAGEGAFLVEVLSRKLKLSSEKSTSLKEYDDNSLIGLSSIYGIEFLQDNLDTLLMNMFAEFSKTYENEVQNKYNSIPNSKVLKSAKTIIKANLVQGDTLKYINSQGNKILFSEWKPLDKKNGFVYVNRIQYSFESIVDDGGPEQNILNQNYSNYDLLTGEFEDERETYTKFKPVKILDVYKNLKE